MRLTNVAHLGLPFGKLVGYDVSVSMTGRRLPISFDQRRHVSRGDRPGSWMAIAFTLPTVVDCDRLEAAWLAVIERHGALRSAFVRDEGEGGGDGDGDGDFHLEDIDVAAGEWVEHLVEPGQAMNDALKRVLDERCTPFSAPSHRLCAIETVSDTTVIIGIDHSHTDMWSMLVILRDLLAAMGESAGDGVPQLAEVPAFAEHTGAMRRRRPSPEEIHRRWAEVLAASGGVMPRFPLPLGEPGPHVERVEVRDVLDVDDAAAFSAQAREDGVSSLSTVVAAMTAVTMDFAGAPLRAVFPVHSRHERTWHDSVGWFITNSVLESADPDPKACAAAVKEAVRLGSWPLEDVMEPWGGMPESPGMFAISWLDLRRLPVRVDSIGLRAQYVGASVRPDGVMLWFILDDTGLHLRCRYPDTVAARRNVGGWLDALVRDIRGRARESVGGLLRRGDRTFRVQRAVRSDVADIVTLLSDGELGTTRERLARESGDQAAYETAFDAVNRDPSQYLAVVKDEVGVTVGTMQLSILPGLSRSGATRLQVEGVRVAPEVSGLGLGTAMLEWAHEHGRARGATLAQLTTDRARPRAHAFYERLGYGASHTGFKRTL
ncbi:GNAT family N-acetyltransferase [uncultured Corynebacterium sp.]|uniref:GNAT family N-acetyltransferase n=1 Tax=uncultured Corynebacterium sp. TaxID=159447 RepID=UPI0025F36FFC|nr:GNAT family N-acetyltransferase [uncultured Corynebacterium sp.]